MPPRPAPSSTPTPRPEAPVRPLAARLRTLLDRYRTGGQGRLPPGKAPLPGDADSTALKLARAALWWERLWPALWRPLSLLGLFLALAWMGLFIRMSPWLHVPLLLAILGGTGWLVRQGLRELNRPTEVDARRRLERDSQLAHRPLSQLQDGIAGGAGDPVAHALWRAAQERARQQAQHLRVDLPDSRLPTRDPWALRVAAALLMVVGATVGWGDLGGRTAGALLPSLGLGDLLTPTRLDAWATPPDYTGQPPVFLTGQKPADSPAEADEEKLLFLPAGTKLVVRLDGGFGTPSLDANDQRVDFAPVAGGGYQIEVALTSGEDVSVRQFGREVASWPIRLVPDQPPGIAFRTPPSATERNALRIDYTGADDYGIHTVTATVTLGTDLAGAIDRTPIDLTLPVPAKNRREITGTGFHDLTGHPWAGMPVNVRLRATDGAGQVSQSAEQTMTLPERHFNHPVAHAIIEQRKTLILMGDAVRPIVGRALHDLSVNLDGYGGDPLAFLALRSAVGRLMRNAGPDTVPSTIAMLWDVALRIEDGNLSLAERELRDAQKALMEALDNNASAEEIDRAMQRLEQAMQEFMDALAQQEAQQQPQNGQPQNQGPSDPDAQSMSREEVEDMVRQMRDLAQSGNHEAARQMLSQLQQLMENLQNGQSPPPQDPQANQQAEALSELARKLRDVQRQQQQLMDETFSQQQDQFDQAEQLPQNQMQGLGMPNRQGRAPNPDGRAQQRSPADPAAGAMASKQDDLRTELGDVMRRLGEIGGEIPRPLGRAERAMKDAADALRSGAPDQAVASQGEALEQLAQTLQSMQEQMARANPGQAGGQRTPSGRQQGRDPLGRPLPGSGSLNGEEVKIPAEADMQRAREILEELRRRASEQNRPKAERDYIDRLLDRFKRY
ncbi:TIGR02302 family protein [Niveispirillum lacus]|uniref:TIGR02302 family protein n=1 Tax=Niveispirillum lacus TaxID=1981099 RepID=A0A255Z009_9PROT|nr:TIGR02302 family protein [Niveispirillum lacus]OYQ34802.1 TIGR02302 family protein [Niveispirillum lacus]